MTDPSMQMPDSEETPDLLTPDSEIPVRIDSLEADGTRPSVGDQVTIKIDGTVKSIENDCVYVTPEKVNDTDLNEILAEHQQNGGDNEDAMRALASNADKMATPMGGGYT